MPKEKTIKVPSKANIRVYWDDKPENYSKEAKNRIRTYFSKKYEIPREKVQVVYRATKTNKNKTELININDVTIENIMDINYQRSLFKEWLEKEKKEVDFDRLLKLDDTVNNELDSELGESNNKKWELKWLTVNNFLCFGAEDNHVDFEKLKGLTVITSNPPNFGGKTTLSIDAIKFLYFGNTTKTDTNEEIFNQFTNEKELIVKGCTVFDGEEIIIERKLSRSPKKSGGWTVSNKVNYYIQLPDGSQENISEEDATATTKKIKDIIGSEKDFEITIISTADTLENLIKSSPTESGKLLTRFIGLEVLETKEEIVKKLHSNYTKTMKSNHYDVLTLEDEIKEHKTTITNNKETLIIKEVELNETKLELENKNKEKDRLNSSKKDIDQSVIKLNPDKINREISEITDKGLKQKTQIESYEKQIKDIGEVTYDELKYEELTKDFHTTNSLIDSLNRDIRDLKNKIKALEEGEICPTCKQPLKDVDHSEEIKTIGDNIIKKEKEIIVKTKEKEKLSSEIESIKIIKTKCDEKNRLELSRDRLDVEIKSLRLELKEKRDELKTYENNLEFIEFNKQVEIDLSLVKTQIVALEYKRDSLIREIDSLGLSVKNNEAEIVNKNKLIVEIRKEAEVDRIFKIYTEMVGKKGISKLVLRSVLPIINAEITKLLDGVVDFDIEITINDKNNVEFLMIKNDVEKKVKSGSGFEKTVISLALRAVIGKMSVLPTPNFIEFDEVLDKVADENLDKVREVFDRIKDMYDIVILITHKDYAKDWADNLITIKKENDISKILMVNGK
jgi:DNA repair exonuclease SbcCD ATPase subunit